MYNTQNSIFYYATITSNWFTSNIAFWVSTLSVIDKHRYDAHKHQHHQKQFLLGRILLQAGAKHINNAVTTAHYKIPNYDQIMFGDSVFYKSISHSGNYVVVFLSNISGNVGIDVEIIKQRNFLDIAKEYFCESEVSTLTNFGCAAEDFYRLWTAKEAYAKATSVQLSTSLKINFSTILLNEHVTGSKSFYGMNYYQQSLNNSVLSVISTHHSSLFNHTPEFIDDFSVKLAPLMNQSKL